MKHLSLGTQTILQAIVFVAILTLIFCGLMYDRKHIHGHRTPETYVLVTIGHNGNVWEATRRYCPSHETQTRFCEEVATINNLSGYTVYEGQQLLVPVYAK